MANSSLTDRATLIAAGLCANSSIGKAVDLSDPSALANHAVRIARAVRNAAREKDKEKPKSKSKSKRAAPMGKEIEE